MSGADHSAAHRKHFAEKIANDIRDRIIAKFAEEVESHPYGQFEAKVRVFIRKGQVTGWEPTVAYTPNFLN